MSASKDIATIQTKKHVANFSIVKPMNAHAHWRDGWLMRLVIAWTVRHFQTAIGMPNLEGNFLTTVALTLAYLDRVLRAAQDVCGEAAEGFDPRGTLYLTQDTDPDEIDRAVDSGRIAGAKLYPYMGTTNAQGAPKSIRDIPHVLERMQKRNLPLLWHAETRGDDLSVDEFDREAVCLHLDGPWLLENFPDLRVCIEHLTTTDGVGFVMKAPGNVVATVAPQHLADNRNALFRYEGKSGLRAHHFCLPVLKREEHRHAVAQAVLSGDPKFIAGDDTAPHVIGKKANAECCSGGIFNEPTALSLYTQLFADHGSQEPDDDGRPKWIRDLEAFLSLNGRRFHNLPIPQERLTIRREAWTPPKFIESEDVVAENRDDARVRVYKGGETLAWKVDEPTQ